MLREDFYSFYEGTIKRHIDKFISQNKGYTFIDNPGRIYEEYLNQKTLMKVVLEKNNALQLLDRHKVCVAMTVAVLKSRPIICDGLNDKNGSFNLSDSSMINEQLAFYCG